MNNEHSTRILYDDEELRVIWRRGSSDFVLFTFSDLTFSCSGSRFFADSSVSKLNINCVGFVAKQGNWFPRENTIPAIEIVNKEISLFQTRVVYGGSMGGYAALKYTAALKATQTIAFCPQWTIDRAECDGFDPGYSEYFNEKLVGMGVRAPDIGGDVYVFYDKHFYQDRMHCKKILENSDGINIINVPSVKHHITTVLSGTGNLSNLIRASRERDIFSMIRTCWESRRESIYRIESILDFAEKRNKRLYSELVVRFALGSKQHVGIKPRRVYRIVHELAKSNRLNEIIHIYRRGKNLFIDPWDQLEFCTFCAALTSTEVIVRTKHKTKIVYDPEIGRCVHRDACSSLEVPLQVRFSGNGAEFYIKYGTRELSLALDPENGFIKLRKGDVSVNCALIGITNACFYISSERGVVSAEGHNDVVIANRAVVGDWECFYFDME